MDAICPFCQSSRRSAVYRAREMMFGRRDEFDYAECGDCRSLWLSSALSPDELAGYYGTGYYSYGKTHDGPLRRWLLDRRNRSELGRWSPLGRLLARRFPERTMRMLGSLGLAPTARILDVGCGGGRLLDLLAGAGFRSLAGVDPFIDRDQRSARGVPITKGYLAQIAGEFDLVMFHHSLEHVVDPIEDLNAARRLLGPGGRCLVRIPTVSSHAWEHYRTDWVQLDAPRHTALPSRQGMDALARRAGFRLTNTIDDSGTFQFVGSERYRANVSLLEGTFDVPPDMLARFAAESERLNAAGRGDQVGFVLET